ncbi:MAG: aminotransferase class IV [Bacteroidota bacterium]
MFLFIETIQVKNGTFPLLHLHEQRLNQTRATFWSNTSPINLLDYLLIPMDWKTGTHKCRVTFGKDIQKIEFETYAIRPIRTVQLVDASHIDYSYKYADRANLNELFEQRGDSDDILMTKDGEITDSWYCNTAFSTGTHWYTPQRPMLAGVRRRHSLETNQMSERVIHAEDLNQYTHFCLFNAMIAFGEIILPTTAINQG